MEWLFSGAQCNRMSNTPQGRLFVAHNLVILLFAQIQNRSRNQIFPQNDLFVLKISQYCPYREDGWSVEIMVLQIPVAPACAEKLPEIQG